MLYAREEDAARAIGERHLLRPGEHLRDVGRFDQDIAVYTSDRVWAVTPIPAGVPLHPGRSYALYDVRYGEAIIDPPPSPLGFAVVSSGDIFKLNDEEQFRAFWRCAGSSLEPTELAALLARYQGGTRSHTLLSGNKDLLRLLYEGDRALVTNLVPPRVWSAPAGFAIDFASCYFRPEAPDYVYRINLDAWHAEVRAAGELRWSSSPIARGYYSPLYGM